METFLIPLHGAMGFGPIAFGGFVTALLVIALVAGLLRTGRVGPVRFDGGTRPGRPAPHHRTPEDEAFATLRSRLATGDITPEEYLARSSVLRRPTTES